MHDTGAMLSIIRKSALPEDCEMTSKTVTLYPAFGRGTTAKLATLHVRLADNCVAKVVSIACAVVEQLNAPTDGLLSHSAFVALSDAAMAAEKTDVAYVLAVTRSMSKAMSQKDTAKTNVALQANNAVTKQRRNAIKQQRDGLPAAAVTTTQQSTAAAAGVTQTAATAVVTLQTAADAASTTQLLTPDVPVTAHAAADVTALADVPVDPQSDAHHPQSDNASNLALLRKQQLEDEQLSVIISKLKNQQQDSQHSSSTYTLWIIYFTISRLSVTLQCINCAYHSAEQSL